MTNVVSIQLKLYVFNINLNLIYQNVEIYAQYQVIAKYTATG